MKSANWLTWTEARQNWLQTLTLFSFSLALGALLNIGSHAYRKIESLVTPEAWNADLAIIPKGMGLNDLRQEMLEGKSIAFLPEALFETTVGLAQGQFALNAVLAITDERGSRVQTKGQREIGTRWLSGRQVLSEWAPQTTYQNPDWGTKVITAFFASGPAQAMQNLKELIDRKSVAQAIWIEKQVQKDLSFQRQLQASLGIVEGVFALLLIFGFVVSGLWMRSRLTHSFDFLFSILGYPKSLRWRVQALLVFYLIFIPLILGILLSAPALNPLGI